MEREVVASSTIASAGYDEATETLEVEFANGTVYQYYNVGPAVYEQFRQSQSKGQYLNVYVKNVFPFSRV